MAAHREAGPAASHAAGGCVPGRVGVEHCGLYHCHRPGGEGTAQDSGRLRHLASGRGDLNVCRGQENWAGS